ncbi:acidic proline-rich protein PRP25-like [Penaeus monodon]|uniref:acidic proline-rich protein PRP25-like n=1 Tax=Penaeus monodon TaxID=6687 RepID=UPI0018A76789|nr:acidic proline-rich protein PRP25-like [Penaeus monodon]
MTDTRHLRPPAPNFPGVETSNSVASQGVQNWGPQAAPSLAWFRGSPRASEGPDRRPAGENHDMGPKPRAKGLPRQGPPAEGPRPRGNQRKSGVENRTPAPGKTHVPLREKPSAHSTLAWEKGVMPLI